MAEDMNLIRHRKEIAMIEEGRKQFSEACYEIIEIIVKNECSYKDMKSLFEIVERHYKENSRIEK